MTTRPCGRSRLDERRDARRLRRDRLVAAGALLAVAAVAVRFHAVGALLAYGGALLAYCLAFLALWFALIRGGAWLALIAAYRRVRRVNWRDQHVPEPRSNVRHPA